MKRLASCVVVSLIASAAVWAGCQADVGLAYQPAIGTGMIDATPVDAAGDGTASDGSVTDGSGGGPGTDGSVTDASVTDGSVTDGSVTDGSVTDGSVIDGSGSGTGTDGSDSGTDGSPGGGLRGNDPGEDDVTSFYACRGRCGSAGADTGLPIALAAVVALRRRRRR